MMPIHCKLPIKCLSQTEFGKLDYTVMSHVFACQNDIGRLAHEQIYHNDMKLRLVSAGFQCDREIEIRLTHGDYIKQLFLDLAVDNRAVYELKTVSALTKDHDAQLITYLYLLNLNHGKLVNLRPPKVESRFVNALIPRNERIGFSVCTDLYTGPTSLGDLIVALLRDWGTCLNLSLYRDAVVHLLGGSDMVKRSLLLARSGNQLGNQVFHLIGQEDAFHFTAFNEILDSYDKQVQQLLSLSPLRAIHRINIAPHELSFKTILRES